MSLYQRHQRQRRTSLLPLLLLQLQVWLLVGLLPVVLARVSYYDILGVSKTANEKEIQRAYRKQALQHHPDKGGEEEKFKELSKAYECLSDPGKRQVYDTYGEAGLENGNGGFPFGGSSASGGSGPSPFSTFFSSNGAAGGSGTGNGFRTESFSFGGSPENIDISQILKEMFMGGGDASSSAFFSPGFTSGSQTQRQRFTSQQTFKSKSQPSATYTQPLHCTLEDLAMGRTKKMKVQYQGQEKIFEIRLKPGWKEGTKIKFQAGHTFPATMVFEVQESPHAYLRRQGNDLHYTCWISESQRKGGIQLKVPLPTGEVWSKHIPRDKSKKSNHNNDSSSNNDAGDDDADEKGVVISHGKKLIVPSMGMPIKGGPERGDLIIDFRVRRSSPSPVS